MVRELGLMAQAIQPEEEGGGAVKAREREEVEGSKVQWMVALR